MACAIVLGVAGCEVRNGYIYEKFPEGEKRVGELRNFDFGYEAVLYRVDGGRSYNFPTSRVLLDVYRAHRRQGDSALEASAKALKLLRDRCPRGGGGDTCRIATAPWRAQEFLRDSLTPIAFYGDACISLRGPISGAGDWTYRRGYLAACRPD